MNSVCETQDLNSIEHSIAALTALLNLPQQIDQVDLFHAQGRVLASDLFAQQSVPAWDNSAMDGYALHSQDLAHSFTLPCFGVMAAGANPQQTLKAKSCMRIYTGAPIPLGADTVVPQENCDREGNLVRFHEVKAGQHIRRLGEEIQQGEPLLPKGTRLRAQEIGLLASQGYHQIPVYRPRRIGIISSGNELATPGEPLAVGQIYDVNRYTLHALLTGWGFAVTHYPNLPDTLDATLRCLQQASQEQELIITSGAVSVSEADHIKAAVAQLGELNLWRVAIQPGKPLAFGKIGNAVWLGLPGNPAATLVTSCIIARPALLTWQGVALSNASHRRYKANFSAKGSVRRQYLQARLVEQFGEIWIEKHPKQSSAMLANASWAEGLAVIMPKCDLQEGDKIEFISYHALLN